MLNTHAPEPLSDLDRQVCALVVPADHFLRLVAQRIDFERFRPRLAGAYSPGMGRPSIDPIRMLKILFLAYHYRLSDRRVMERARTDMAFRWFLGLPMTSPPPHHTEGTYFRHRIGVERFTQVFQDLLTQAREAGLVRDRLRLKDATHLIANVADLRALPLVAQMRERLCQVARPFFPDWVQAQRDQAEVLRQATAEAGDDERLAARVEHLREMTAQLHERAAGLPAAAADDRGRARLCRVLEVAKEMLADRDHPGAGDAVFSSVDPDARVGKHGDFFAGYLLDLAIDADSELITAVNVLPGNGAEAADAVTLIQQEEAAQGNDVQALSMDGIGYNGPVLRDLTDPQGLNLAVTVPLPAAAPRTTFGPERFTLTVIDAEQAELTCPNGQATRQRRRNGADTGDRYQFRKSQCAGCPLRAECLQNPASPRGRVVDMNDYAAEYRAVETQAQTAEYQETRRTHRKIERKLGEVVRHHQMRRARYWGMAKVRVQALLGAWVVNVKRMVKLLAPADATATQPLCAAAVSSS